MEALVFLGLGTAFHVYRQKHKKQRARKRTDQPTSENSQNRKWMMVAVDPASPAVPFPPSVPSDGSAAAAVRSSFAAAKPSDIPAPAAVFGSATAAGAAPSNPAKAAIGVLPMGDMAFAAGGRDEYAPVSFGAGKAAGVPASVAAPSLFPAAVRPNDMGGLKPAAPSATPKTFSVVPGEENDGWTMSGMPLNARNADSTKLGSTTGSSIQILPPVLTGGAAEYGYSILQVRRNRSSDIRGDIKPFMPENNPCSMWRSSFAEQAKYNKPVTLIHNEIIPMPPTYDQLKNFFGTNSASAAPGAATGAAPATPPGNALGGNALTTPNTKA
jgi:hypothetical protein